uniref:Uncharacterized protein n=1 Tax=Meloidogyne javanica TaxID=6303 RepID=A0A915LFZ1_MELJA
MSRILRQELGVAVTSLVERLKNADSYIDKIKSTLTEEEERELLIEVEMELVHLSQRTEKLQSVIRHYHKYMEGLNEAKQDEEENFLVNYLTDDEKSDRNEIQHHWPITSLVNRAEEAINRLKAYRVMRQMTESNSNNSPSAQGSINLNESQQTHIIRPNQERRQLYSDEEEEREWTRQRRNVRQNDRDTYEPELRIRQEASQTTFSSLNALKVDSVRLPTFGGDIREWRTFWASFEHAVDRQPEGSTAREAIIGYPPSDTNYPIVKEILKDKYGNDDQLSDQLEAQLLKLQPIRNNLRELTQFQKEVERICLQLESLGGPRQRVLCNIIKSKLPQAILQQLITEELHSKRKWDDKHLRHALADIVKIRQSTEECMTAFKDEPRKDQPRDQNNSEAYRRERFDVRPTRQEIRPAPRPIEQTRAFPVFNANNNGRSNEPFCSLCCNNGHKPSQCSTYSTPQERKTRLLEQGRCLKCLQQSHTTEQCQRSFKCQKCGSTDHHFILCAPRQAAIEYQTPHAISHAPRLAVQPSNVQSPTSPARSFQQTSSKPSRRQTPPRRNERPTPKKTGGNATTLNNQRATTTMSSTKETTDTNKEVKEDIQKKKMKLPTHRLTSTHDKMTTKLT